MFNLIKAQQYRTLRDYATYMTVFVGVLFYVFTTLVTLSDSSGDTNDAGHFFLLSATAFSIVGSMIMMTLTAQICGSDMLDRTMNFELLDGAKRSRVYLSRFILSLCWGLGIMYAIVLIPMIFMGAAFGWGNVISIAAFAKRMAVLFFPFVRIIALYTALTFILGDWRAVFAIGFILCQVELVADMLLAEITKLPIYVRALFSVSSINVMLDVENIGFDYIDAKDIQVVKDTLTASDNIVCVVISAVMAGLFLVVGLKIFEKKDLK